MCEGDNTASESNGRRPNAINVAGPPFDPLGPPPSAALTSISKLLHVQKERCRRRDVWRLARGQLQWDSRLCSAGSACFRYVVKSRPSKNGRWIVETIKLRVLMILKSYMLVLVPGGVLLGTIFLVVQGGRSPEMS